MTKEQEDSGFKVTDRRLFREDGEIRQDAPEPEPLKEKAEPFKVAESVPPKQEAPGTGARIDFPSYILSYYTQGLVLLGEVPNPYTNKKEEDLQSARHTVDILTILQEKTRGNLSKEEDELLDSVLYELRMKFMAKSSKIKL
jgi:Domain of unknown function (DUF1844)